ncbi:13006_t:CDS:2, partial [Entrophospora sp. SA101]
MPLSEASGSLYIPDSDISADSLEYLKKKNPLRFEYLVGPGMLEFGLTEESVIWTAKDTNISNLCDKFRTNSIKASEEKILSAHEELALSHIFLLEEGINKGLRQYIDDETWTEIFKKFRLEYKYVNVDESVWEIWNNIVKITCKQIDDDQFKEEVKDYLSNYNFKSKNGNDDNQEEIIKSIFINLVDKYQLDEDAIVEDTHIHKYLSPLIDPFFPENQKIKVEWANKMSISSAEDRRSFDPSLFGSKPDFLIRTTNTNYVELLLAEIKPTKVSIKLFSNDLVKLGKEMKSSIDKIIDEGLLDVSVYGIHGAGEICKCYIMDLKSEGIYRMMVLGKFIIPRDPTSWATVINCFQILITLKGLVYESANNYYDTSRQILCENSEKTTYQQKFKRHGFHPPLKLMVNELVNKSNLLSTKQKIIERKDEVIGELK